MTNGSTQRAQLRSWPARSACARPVHDGAVVVLGGTGCIGRWVCHMFERSDRRVTAVSRRLPANAAPGRTVLADLTTMGPKGLADLFRAERAAVVVNASGGLWGLTDEQLHESMVTVVERVIDALAAVPWPVRLVQLGSVHEYQPQTAGRCVDERTPLRPTSEYGRLKLRAGEAVLTAARCGRVDGVVLRLANVVGPGVSPYSLLGRVAGQLADAAKSGRPAVLRLAPLRDRRDYVDARDVARAVTAAAAAPVAGRAINVGRGEAIRVRQLVDQLVEVSGVAAEVEETAQVKAGAVDGASWLQVDVRTAASVLGWTPRIEMAESLRALWADARVG